MNLQLKFIIYFGMEFSCIYNIVAMNMQQFEQSLDILRSGCVSKFKIDMDLLNKLRVGEFTEGNHELMCYTKCVAQLAGTLTRKGDFNVQKAMAQTPYILPPELHDTFRASLVACKDVQSNYKESCERIFYITKCIRDHSPATFKFP